MNGEVLTGGNVMVLAEHTGLQVSDGTHELIGKAHQLAEALGGVVEVALLGPSVLSAQLGDADIVVSVEHPALAEYVPEAYERALLEVLAQRAPRLLLMTNATIGLDLGGALAVRWGAPLASYAAAVEAEGGTLTATLHILGGKVQVEVELPGDRAVVTVLGGTFSSLAAPPVGAPAEVVSLAPPAGLDALRMMLDRVVAADAGDVDISAADLLVSVGRGIESADNLVTVQELADVLGAALSGSRPVVDAGWLPKGRQVGQSGLKVKPRAYLALGISGAPEHLEGMRNSELIIACNTDPAAPIFGAAHYGTTIDLFDLVPELVERLAGGTAAGERAGG